MTLASPPPPPASLTSPRYTFYSPSELPPFETVSRLVSAFARGSSPLMYMLAEYEAMELINAVYSPTTRPTVSQLCELLAIAAVGAQYEDVDSSTTNALFRSAKWYLDIEYARDGDMLRKMRVSMLVGLFLIFEKSFFALDYLGTVGNRKLETEAHHIFSRFLLFFWPPVFSRSCLLFASYFPRRGRNRK